MFRNSFLKTILLPLFLFIVPIASVTVRAQNAASTQTAPPPAAKPADVATIESTIAALYDVISGPAGKRDWDRFRALFIPGARLIPTNHRQTGEAVSRVLTPEEYIQLSAALLEHDGFFERQVSQQTETFANIAHVFSTYESRHRKAEAIPFARGINSIQLMNDGTRWWVVTILWQAEDATNQLPEKYRGSKK